MRIEFFDRTFAGWTVEWHPNINLPVRSGLLGAKGGPKSLFSGIEVRVCTCTFGVLVGGPRQRGGIFGARSQVTPVINRSVSEQTGSGGTHDKRNRTRGPKSAQWNSRSKTVVMWGSGGGLLARGNAPRLGV